MLLVIGYGNPLRADDGIGQVVANRLADRLRSPAVRIITAHQLTPELAEPISRASMAIFIDACEGERPGAVACKTVALEAIDGAFTHHSTPATLLTAARELYGNSPAGLLISIVGMSFDYGTELSPQMTNALPHLTEQLIGLIGKNFFA
jgi:hydrogenase maturation protease